MVHARVIPCLLMRNGGLVKTVKYKNARYVGDPINAVRIFNEKEVDELVFLDIGNPGVPAIPNFELLAEIASEAFMPFAYGGNIKSIEHVKRLYSLGVEKIVLNTAAADQPDLVSAAAALAGSSGVIVSIDVRRNWMGKYSVHVAGGTRDLKRDPVEYARAVEQLGAGEILLNAIDRDGTMEGYDLELIGRVCKAVSIPVVAAGGAAHLPDLRNAAGAGASGLAAGSMFVFHGKHRAVLITYPEYEELERLFK
ncbi:AglZ/HisF2 family acetamidino modification protein [Massilia litorea]|uniref:imidazole glycerol-phosphate synthase n=1 Tax=Massilia litorea TaxID=2769491 RepID=A0A7L9UB81_9BURK|nr:AglZ/HisF2 family acetamidino modification protein [Massilia litorea]QOL52304.1 imidazole glycerol phosphate synthase subunit HisF [Massilia litorea]